MRSEGKNIMHIYWKYITLQKFAVSSKKKAYHGPRIVPKLLPLGGEALFHNVRIQIWVTSNTLKKIKFIYI
jgi:hypothetical protein